MKSLRVLLQWRAQHSQRSGKMKTDERQGCFVVVMAQGDTYFILSCNCHFVYSDTRKREKERYIRGDRMMRPGCFVALQQYLTFTDGNLRPTLLPLTDLM